MKRKMLTSSLTVLLLLASLLPLVSVITTSSVFAKENESVFFDLQTELADLTDFGDGTVHLQKAGSPTLTIAGEKADKALTLSDRENDWYALDLKVNSFDFDYSAEYLVTIHGTTSEADKLVKIGEAGGSYSEFVRTNSDTSQNFTLEKTFTNTELKNLVDTNTNLRIQAETNVDFTITSFIITEKKVGATLPQAPETGLSAGTTVLYDLATDATLQNATANDTYTLPAILATSNPVTIKVASYNDKNSLLVTDRKQDWSGLDINKEQFKVDGKFVDGNYQIKVTGHADTKQAFPTDAKIKLAMNAAPWTTFDWVNVSQESPEFALNYDLDLSAQQLENLAYSFRIQGENNPEIDFYIDELTVSVTQAITYSFTFDETDKTNFESQWTTGGASTLSWADDFGNGDSYALKAVHKQADYNRVSSSIRFVPETPLPAGQYRVKADFFVPAQGAIGKESVLKGAAVLVNNNSSVSPGKIPTEGVAGAETYLMPVGEWVTLEGVTQEGFNSPVEAINFGFYTNGAPTHPDEWYIDNVEIEQIGAIEIEEWPEKEWDLSLKSLKEAYQNYFPIGNIMEVRDLEDDYNTAEMFKHHFNVMTPENAMKPDQISKAKDQYDFTAADKLVDWALNNGIALHAHTLVWHSQSAAWLNTGEAANRATASENMKNYIETVAGHYKGRATTWDVVNEAFANAGEGFDGSDWRTALRKDSPWYIAYANNNTKSSKTLTEDPSDYIYDAYVLARKTDPNAILYYNDYNEEIPAKRDAIALMVMALNQRWLTDDNYDGRLLIEGIGMQSHYWGDSFDAFLVDEALATFVATGAKVSISEVDMPVGAWNNQHNGKKLTKEEETQQAVNYAKLFALYKKYAKFIGRVTIWGKGDDQSWRASGMPLLFDNSFTAKEAYYAVLEPEKYLAEHADIAGDMPSFSPVGTSDTEPTEEPKKDIPNVTPSDNSKDKPKETPKDKPNKILPNTGEIISQISLLLGITMTCVILRKLKMTKK
ncbi:hypothetical protein Hs30E_00930 [Lactococcus hodotermopsidis]|uniref:Beta-xylanase n=1 Tax=Pseudolactococcus hodotermopsidis TaxID=2709157 RepID=A0A6A0B8A4_9LACT|nr:endo-1,4-beta-xylanase [Lactococcus hodotermopsidis]GFH41542.1 hypothetical protein Hs30E_00930 [Lactococcus hodotermopsidis]